jgi:hypothetical protein
MTQEKFNSSTGDGNISKSIHQTASSVPMENEKQATNN